MQSANDNQKIHVRVLFFGAARDIVDLEELDLSLTSPASAADAKEQIITSYPDLRRFGNSLLFAVNQEYALGDREIHDGDELAVFPPVSGGGGANDDRRRTEPLNTGNTGASPASTPRKDFFELTTDPIEVGTVARRVVLPECGATVTLDGYAREWTRGRRTLHLVYEAYEPMALTEMQRLGREAH